MADDEAEMNTDEAEMNTDEAEIVALKDWIDAELRKSGIRYAIFHEEVEESWHITISAGWDITVNGGGAYPEFGLVFWGPTDEWLWSCVTSRHDRSGPWPCRDLDAGASGPEVARYVVDGLNAYSHEDCTVPDCDGGDD